MKKSLFFLVAISSISIVSANFLDPDPRDTQISHYKERLNKSYAYYYSPKIDLLIQRAEISRVLGDDELMLSDFKKIEELLALIGN